MISVLDGGRCPPALECAKSGVVLPPNALVLKMKLKYTWSRLERVRLQRAPGYNEQISLH